MTTASAAPTPDAGTGLTGLADRLAVVEGAAAHLQSNRRAYACMPEIPCRTRTRSARTVPDRSGLRVVLAEDSLLLRDGLIGVLRRFGHEVVAAVGDADALPGASAHLPASTSSSPTCACRPATPTTDYGPRYASARTNRACRSWS